MSAPQRLDDETRSDPAGKIYRAAPGCSIQALDVGTREPAFLITSSQGVRYRCGRVLHDVLELLDGQRSLAGVVEQLSSRAGRRLDAGQLDASVLIPALNAGLVTAIGEDGAQSAVSAAPARREAARLDLNPLTLNPLRLTIPILPERWIAPVARVGAVLFHPLVFALCWVAVAAVFALVFADYARLAASVREHRVGGYQFAAAYLLAMFSVFLHELGHASAAARFGARTGTIGVGLYLVFPALFADVSDVWRLRSRQRLLVDVGGMYFQLIAGAAYYGLYRVSGERSFLWAVLAIVVMVLFSLNPLFKFDGYWMLSDALGIPNLRRRAGDALSAFIRNQMAPAHLRGAPSPLLSMSRTRYAFFFGYAIVSQVFLLAILYFIVELFPFIVLEYPAFLIGTAREAWSSLQDGDALTLGSKLFSLFFRTLFVVGVALTIQSWSKNTLRLLTRAMGNLRALPAGARFRGWLQRIHGSRVWGARPRLRTQHALLVVSGSFLAFCGLYGTALVHEFAHVAIGWLLGGTPALVSCQPVGRSTTFVLFAPDTPQQALGLYHLAGPVAAGAVGLAALLLGQRRASGWAALHAAALGIYLLVGSLAYLCRGALEGSGDAAQAAATLSVPPLMLAIFFGTCLFFALLLGARALFEALAPLVPVETPLERLVALSALLGLPLSVVVYALSMSGSTGAPAIPLAEASAVAALMLAAATAFATSDRSPATWRWSAWIPIPLLAGGALGVWLCVFPPGRPFLELGVPPEYRVQAVNVELAVQSDGSLSAEILMQPFTPADEVLWERVRRREPLSWQAYDSFAATLLDGMIEGATWRIAERQPAPEAVFFRDRQYRGARIVRATARPQAPPRERIELHWNDTWKRQSTGYVDRFRVCSPDGWSWSSVDAEPRDHSARVVRDARCIVLRNSDAKGPRSLRFELERDPPAGGSGLR